MTIKFLAQGEHQGAALPSFPSLTLFAQRPTVLLSTAAFPSTLLSRLWDIPHCFFHCNKEFYHSMLFVTTLPGRLHFEEL